MAHIKCKYSRSVCRRVYEYLKECHYHFSEYDDHCSCIDYERKDTKRLFDYDCRFLGSEEVRFEKDIKSYELDETYFTVGRRTIINRYNISFLEIDGEVIIQEEKNNETN